jgi:hypothetical protein
MSVKRAIEERDGIQLIIPIAPLNITKGANRELMQLQIIKSWMIWLLLHKHAVSLQAHKARKRRHGQDEEFYCIH